MMRMASIVLKDKGLPKKFWVEVVSTAIDVQQRKCKTKH